MEIILMVAIVTSLMAPPILRWTLSHVEPSDEERERLEAEARRRESFVGNLKRVLLPVRSKEESDVAARVVGLMVAEEDVEVTSLYLRRNGDEDLEQTKEAIGAHLDNSRTRVKAEEDSPADVILDEAKRGYDLLALAATERRTSGGEDSLFDRFVDDVIQEAPCPLLVITTPADGDGAAPLGRLNGGHILVPTSGSPTDGYAAEVAFSLAARCGTEVDIVHVVSGPQHAVRLGADEAVTHAVEIGEDLVAKIADLGRAMGATVNTDVLVADHPEHAIVERAERRADMIVLASSRKPVSQRAFFGHRVDYVVGHAPCPVVVVSA